MGDCGDATEFGNSSQQARSGPSQRHHSQNTENRGSREALRAGVVSSDSGAARGPHPSMGLPRQPSRVQTGSTLPAARKPAAELVAEPATELANERRPGRMARSSSAEAGLKAGLLAPRSFSGKLGHCRGLLSAPFTTFPSRSQAAAKLQLPGSRQRHGKGRSASNQRRRSAWRVGGGGGAAERVRLGRRAQAATGGGGQAPVAGGGRAKARRGRNVFRCGCCSRRATSRGAGSSAGHDAERPAVAKDLLF